MKRALDDVNGRVPFIEPDNNNDVGLFAQGWALFFVYNFENDEKSNRTYRNEK